MRTVLTRNPVRKGIGPRARCAVLIAAAPRAALSGPRDAGAPPAVLYGTRGAAVCRQSRNAEANRAAPAGLAPQRERRHAADPAVVHATSPRKTRRRSGAAAESARTGTRRRRAARTRKRSERSRAASPATTTRKRKATTAAATTRGHPSVTARMTTMIAGQASIASRMIWTLAIEKRPE